MKTKQFDFMVDTFTDMMKDTLKVKALEYANPKGDRLQNFKDAARFEKCTEAQALWGMVSKHIVALNSFVLGEVQASPSQIFEKIMDTAVYMNLLAALNYESNKEFTEYYNARTEQLPEV